MPFNKSIADIIASGVRINFTNSNAQMADLYAADQEYLIPVLGDDLYNTLTGSNPDAKYTQLILLCKRAEAPLAYWLDLPNIQTQISDRGLVTTETTSSAPAHKWEYNEVRESLMEKGCKAMEFLLQYLYANATTVGWTEPDEYKSIFRTAKDFNRVYSLSQPYRTFLELRTIIKTVEDKYIRPSIGSSFFDTLMDYTDSDPYMVEAIDLVKKAVANLSIYKASLSLRVKFSSQGFTVLLGDAPDSVSPSDKTGSNKQISYVADAAETDGAGYLKQLKDDLNANASDTVFSDYFNSSYYVAPLTDIPESRNATRQSFGLS